jgi:predicted Zn-dependent protease
MSRSAAGVAVVLASLAGTGCTTDGQWSVRRAIGWEEVKTPGNPNIPRAHTATAEKVESLGKRIIAQSSFTGLDQPLFYTIGVPESVLFHRGAGELFISEGLVAKCKTEDELAAVLCSELGQMMAEKRSARRAGADRDTFPDAALPGGVTVGGGTPDDPGRAAEIAYREKRPTTAPVVNAADATKFGCDLLKGAGYDPAELEKVAPLLKQSERGAALRKQMSGTAPAPEWK